VKKLHDPLLPTEKEVQEHYVSGHMPYRSWCHHCVRGRGRERDHAKKKKKEDEERGLPEYHLDYCFPGDETDDRLTVLVVIEKYSKMKKAVVVPSKGSTGSYAAKMVLELMAECGDADRDVILKTDQEAAIKFLVDDVCMNRTGARTIKELVPKGSKGSNGVVERAVQSVEQVLRTMKSALDERMGVKIDIKHPINTWLCEFAGYMMNRMEVASDGKTPYERIKGKKAEVLGLEFGEKVLWKYHVGKKMEKLNARWGHGIFVGVRAKSNELMVIDEETQELKYTRTARRVPESQRWDSNNLAWVGVVPWNRSRDDKEADGELPDFNVKKGPGRQLTDEEKKDIATSTTPRITHRAHLRRDDFEKHGFTDRCPGCSALLRGLHVQPHSAGCRARMEEVLAKDVRVKNAKARLQERGARVMNEQGEAKRRRLAEIEDEAMKEEDPVKLADLFEKYRVEYLNSRNENDGENKKQRTEEPAVLQERASGSGQPAVYEEMQIGQVQCVDPWEYLETVQETGGTAKLWNSDNGECLETPEAENAAYDEEYAWDDVNDFALPIGMVKKARMEEMGHMKNKIFKVVKKEEAWRVTGKAPISTKWVDTDKTHGTGEPMVRSRWVARDFKDPKEKDREDLFSATPPIELMRFVLSRQATRRKDGIERKTLFLDIKKAHLAPLCQSDVYVELPEEAEVKEDECGKLIHWLYGCRPAAQAWEEHYSELLCRNGFTRLKSVPVAFAHKERDMVGVVHGDDFVWEGRDKDLDWVLGVLQNEYELKNRGRLGFGPNDVRRIDMLGRVIELTEEGVSWGGDPRHQKLLEEYFGMDGNSKPLSKNGYEEDERGDKDEDCDLTKVECKAFRKLAARLNYMSQDNIMLQFAAKEACRNMASPRLSDFAKIKRIVRFLIGVGEVKLLYRWQTEEEARNLTVFVDSDWAGCKATRRSTSGGVLKVGQHVLKTWSTTQSTIATSSGEAELIAMHDGASRAMGLQTVMFEVGLTPKLSMLRVYTDSTVAKSFVATRGLGKMRHLEVKLLWLQEAVQKGRLSVGKVKGTANIADALTKYHSASKLSELCAPHGVLSAAQTSDVVGPRGGDNRSGAKVDPSVPCTGRRNWTIYGGETLLAHPP
jgi:hypothetical protein